MKNRFTQKRAFSPVLQKAAVSIVLFVCCAFLLVKGAHSIQQNSHSSQLESLRQAITRSAVHCYATEGAYPESLNYIKEHYGIRWDESKYVVDYEITGSNLMPGIHVFAIPAKEG